MDNALLLVVSVRLPIQLLPVISGLHLLTRAPVTSSMASRAACHYASGTGWGTSHTTMDLLGGILTAQLDYDDSIIVLL